MKIITTVAELREILEQNRQGKTVGFVPTMGYLHSGHESLIKKARENNDILVVSIYVNPTQFAPNEDLASYPRDLERDSKICEALGVDYIFHPTDAEMYPTGYSTFVVPGDNMTNILCGITRPTHFRGVCTIVSKLFNIVQPNNAYFGEKDIQQLAILKRMATDLNIPVNIFGCPIVREEDGLAKSSRNVYLNFDERQVAPILRASILEAVSEIERGERNAQLLLTHIKKMIEEKPHTKIDYVEILDFTTFERLTILRGKVVIALAVYVGKTRLIDNYVLEIKDN